MNFPLDAYTKNSRPITFCPEFILPGSWIANEPFLLTKRNDGNDHPAAIVRLCFTFCYKQLYFHRRRKQYTLYTNKSSNIVSFSLWDLFVSQRYPFDFSTKASVRLVFYVMIILIEPVTQLFESN